MIQFENVVKRFRRNQVLKGVDLNIERGHRVALVGSNGAGKTTLIRCLLGEYTCEGRVLVDGLDPRQHRRAVLSKVGFVPQLPPPLKMPVRQLVRFAASLCDADPRRIETVAGRLGLDVENFHGQPFVKLSGGQKQKLLIAIALGRDSELLVLDEPTANLDPGARHIFFQLLAEKKAAAAMLISSHRLDEVASLVNRVIEMDQGSVVLDDRVADLGRQVGALPFVTHCYRRPRHMPDWPYNLFAMLHGTTREEVEAKRADVAALLGSACRGNDILYSTRILKKTGMRLHA